MPAFALRLILPVEPLPAWARAAAPQPAAPAVPAANDKERTA